MELDYWQLALIVTKFVIYTSSFVAIGGAIFLLIFNEEVLKRPKHTKDMIYLSSFISLFISIVFLLVQTGYIIDDGISGMFDPEMLQLFLGESIGTSLYLRVMGMFMLISLSYYSSKNKFFLLVPIVMVAASFSLVGHATGEFQLYTSILVIVHLIAVSFWVGALLPLYLSADLPNAASLLDKFGKVASFIVPLLIVVGLLFAYFIIGSFTALFTSSYGITFIIKIIVVGFLLGLATLNKIFFVPQIASQKTGAVKRLRTTIITEALAFLIIFAVTAVLTTSVTLP